MNQQLVTPATAKLAAQKGFDWQCEHICHGQKDAIARLQYHEGDATGFVTNSGITSRNAMLFGYEDPVHCAVPTQAWLQAWLRDKHGLHIEILLSEDSPYNQFYYRIMKIGQYFTLAHDAAYYESYEQALEQALFKALLKLKNQ
jgi:hypothetical protein